MPTGRLAAAEAVATRLSNYVAALGVALMLLLSVLTIVDVTMRAVSRSPIAGFNEIVEQFLAIAVVACFPAATVARRHLSLDLLVVFLGPRVTRWLRLTGALFLLAGLGAVTWRIGIQTAVVAGRGDSTTIMAFPRGPIMWTITSLLILSVIVQIIVFAATFADAAGIRRTAAGIGAVASRQHARPLRDGALFFLSIAVLCGGYAALHEAVAPYLQEHLLLLFTIGFIMMWGLSLLLVPLGISMMVAGVAGLAVILDSGPAFSSFGSLLSDFLVRINLAVLPLFVLMGGLAAAAGLSEDLFRFAQALLGRARGGLALATIGGCAGFGAVTGSSIATVVTIGRVALPEMNRRGYSTQLSTGTIAAGGTLGILVPPSGAMVLYALLTEVSIGRLFVAALLPAVLTVFTYMLVVWIIVYRRKDTVPDAEAWDLREIYESGKGALAVVGLFGVVLGGIYGGFFTAIEAAAVGAGGAFLIALLRGRLKRAVFFTVMGETAWTTGMLYILIFGGITFSAFVSLTEVTEGMVAYIQTLNLAPVVVIAILLFVFVLLGSVMEAYAIMLITVPVTAPLISALGYDLIWWGIVQIVVIEAGLLTPPVGMNVFAIKSIDSSISLPTVFKGVMPFVGADVVVLALMTAFPAIVLWLPSTMN